MQSAVAKGMQIARNRPNSRQRLSQLKKQQQYLSEMFKIDNFYNNETLDITNLKKKINDIKKKPEEIKDNPEDQNKSKQKQVHKITLVPLSNRIHKLQKVYAPAKNDRDQLSRQAIFTRIQKRGRQDFSKNKGRNEIGSARDQKTIDQSSQKTISNQQTSQEKHRSTNQRYLSIDNRQQQLTAENLYGTAKSTIIPKIQNIGRRRSIAEKSEKSQSIRKILNSSRLQPIGSIKKKTSFIKVQKQQQLIEFEKNVTVVWQIYEKLSQIIKHLSNGSQQIFREKFLPQQFIQVLCSYKALVCSAKLQFIIQIIDNCLQFRHAKTIILSRLLENLSVVYVFLEIIDQATNIKNKVSSSFLINFVGICSNNLLLLLRLITLICIINESLTISDEILKIFHTISSFQISSYRSQITSLKDVAMRMQHNNELVFIIQGKLTNKLSSKEYHKSCFGKFLREVVVDRLKEQIQIAGQKIDKLNNQTKPFFQYSYFIFEYLAFHLHHEQYLGFFPKQIQTAPQPYTPLVKQFTIIIDPSKVLVHSGREKVYVRAFAERFILELSQKCNIIFWSTKMPNQIDNIYNLIDVVPVDGQRNGMTKRLYKHHCFYDINSRNQVALIKDISRVGCLQGKYIIFDSTLDNYYEEDFENTIFLPWKGEGKDKKLATVLDFLLPFLREGTDLRKGLQLLKPRIEQLLNTKKRIQKFSVL